MENPDQSLPGEPLARRLRRTVARIALGDVLQGDDQAARLEGVLHLWSAFDRSWLERLLPPVEPDAFAVTGADKSTDVPDLEPVTSDGLQLRTLWPDLAPELVARGRNLSGANLLPFGIEELLADAYFIAARQWRSFTFRGHEETIRWLLCILRNLLRRSLQRMNTQARALSDEQVLDEKTTSRTQSQAEEREVIAFRLRRLHDRFPSDCKAAAFEERMIARSTLELFVVGETLETVLTLKPNGVRLWSSLVLQRRPAAEVAALQNVSVGTMRTQFHRLRDAAIKRLANRWTRYDE